MYNWSVDEKKFKNIQEIVDFLENQPEVIWVKVLKRTDKFGNTVIKIKLAPSTHPVREFFIGKYIQERVGELKVCVIKEIFK
jgi:hypothetical protein